MMSESEKFDRMTKILDPLKGSDEDFLDRVLKYCKSGEDIMDVVIYLRGLVVRLSKAKKEKERI